ncbi:hypothetical protein C8R46DRAFT_1208812 [Mycena filopes]|nr:hypothetical protein C8R46DRAFT_1208812 [Mycena filopes]
MDSNQKASVAVSFVVVGGSISGLACGYALREAGHHVLVLEKTDGPIVSTGTIRSPPNMTKILKKWPGMEEVLRTGTKCSGISFRRGDTSEPVGFMKFHEQIMSELQADYYILQYDTLHRELKSLCLAAGVELRYGCTAVDVEYSGSKPGSAVVKLADGSVAKGDIVIIADGHNSLLPGIVAEDDMQLVHTATGINISIPTHIVQEYSEWNSLCNLNEQTIWMGNGSCVVGTLDDTCKTFDLALCFPKNLDIEDGNWSAGCPKDMTPFDLTSYDSRLQKLIRLGTTGRPTVQHLFKREDLVRNGTLVSVGDAAHSATIHGSHNSSMAIEDAETLGRLFSRITNANQIPQLLNAYQEIRHPRTSTTQDSEYQSLVQICLPFGPDQEARDAVLQKTLVTASVDLQKYAEEAPMVIQMWEKYLVLFNHSASDAVDNWWSMWGRRVELTGNKSDP